MKNPHKGRTGLSRVLHAFGYSMQGLATALRTESAFRQEAALALVVEMLNSAIEAVVDRVSFDLHELSKRAKDYGSAAVLLSLVWCGGVWAAALYQRWMA